MYRSFLRKNRTDWTCFQHKSTCTYVDNSMNRTLGRAGKRMGTFILSYKNVTHTQWINSRAGTDGYALFIPVHSKNPNSNNNSNRSTQDTGGKPRNYHEIVLT